MYWNHLGHPAHYFPSPARGNAMPDQLIDVHVYVRERRRPGMRLRNAVASVGPWSSRIILCRYRRRIRNEFWPLHLEMELYYGVFWSNQSFHASIPIFLFHASTLLVQHHVPNCRPFLVLYNKCLFFCEPNAFSCWVFDYDAIPC